MSDPIEYDPDYSFSAYQASNPNRPLPAPRVDDELANISAAINNHRLAIMDVRRSDGALKNASVGPDQLRNSSVTKDKLAFGYLDTDTKATEAEARAGVSNVPYMTPYLTSLHLAANVPALIPKYTNVSVASQQVIAPDVKRMETDFFTTSFNPYIATLFRGGAHYRRVSLSELGGYPALSYFRTQDRYTPTGVEDETNGGYWLLDERYPDITQFGAAPNATGVAGAGTDSTAAIHAAIDWCKLTGAPVRVPAGQFRVTSGYTHNAAFQEISFVGEGEVTRNALGVNPSSAIILDSSSSSSFFYRATGSSGIRVSGMTFGCAQEVKDRKFFRFSENQGVKQIFRDVQFVKVEKPVVYEAGSYFQWSSYENVAFRNSGTIHSEVVGVQGQLSTLVGTGLTLINVSHDGSIADATDKVVMNLQGIREIQSLTLLLEGGLPSTGWTILKSDCLYDNGWEKSRVGTFIGTHIEWSGASTNIDYLLDLGSGRFRFDGAYFTPAAAQRIRLNGHAEVELDGFSATSSTDLVNDMFTFNGVNGHVTFVNSTLRLFLSADNRFTVRHCTLGIADGQAREGSNAPSLVARWEGGYLDGTALNLSKSGAVGFTPSVDTTYGRKMVITPSSNTLDPSFTTPLARYTAGDQVTFVAKVKMPVYTTGNILVRVLEGATGHYARNYGPAYSGQIVELRGSGKLTGGSSGSVSLSISASSITDLSDVLEVYSLAAYKGDDTPRSQHASHPRNIVTWNSAAPAAGEWARGDVVWNTAPSAAGAPGWMCTTAGTPGTWKAMANLAA